MNTQDFEEQYMDVLQNIEFGIVQVARRHKEMTDWEALSVVEALMRRYRAESRGYEPRPPKSLRPLAQETYNSVHSMCEWRLGRVDLVREDGSEFEFPMIEPLTVDEIYSCLKRVRKSIEYWTKRGGRQGYLTFIDDFFPQAPPE